MNDKNNGQKFSALLTMLKESRWVSGVGLICAAVITAVTIFFAVQIWNTKMIPGQWMGYICAGLGAVLLLAVALLLNHRNKVRFVLGAVLSVGLAAALLAGGMAVQRGVDALNRITSAEKQIEYIGVYVPVSDPIEHLEDAGDYTFGVFSGMDPDINEKTMTTLSEALEKELDTVSYDTIPALLDALFVGEVDAIIFPDAFFDLLGDMEGYTDAQEKIRALITLDFEVESGEMEKPEMPDHTFTVYISGIDSRYGLTARSRSDVNILAHVNTKTRQVLLVSTPRDFYVPLSISNGVPDKLTHAGIYGVDVSKDTIGMLYGIDIDYYFRVNFEGFEEIIDSLGGVTVNSEYSFTVGSHHFVEGENDLNGKEALVFARERYSLPGGDRQRGKNQMAVIQGVINKVLSPDILKNYTSVLEAVEGNFETTVPYELVAELVRTQLENGGSWDIITYSADGRGDSQIPYSMSVYAYVMIPDQETVDRAKNMIQAMENNETITQP